jgi:hypothetical protein
MTRIIDADGHINDYAYGDEIARYMPKGNQSSVVFPVLVWTAPVLTGP